MVADLQQQVQNAAVQYFNGLALHMLASLHRPDPHATLRPQQLYTFNRSLLRTPAASHSGTVPRRCQPASTFNQP